MDTEAGGGDVPPGMTAALAVFTTALDVTANLAAMESMTQQARMAGADIILFPEAALTGLINNDDPQHDLPLGQPIPGPATDALARAARQHRIYLGAGILEREAEALYDSAVLFGPDGDIILKYRRIQPQWHGRHADPAVYLQGDCIATAATPLGTMAFLICGDLFDDDIVSRVRRLGPDYLLFPFSRNFSDGRFDRKRWESDEEPQYTARASLAGCTVLMVNQLEDPRLSAWPSFGGAMVVSGDGEVVARMPIGRPGILYARI